MGILLLDIENTKKKKEISELKNTEIKKKITG